MIRKVQSGDLDTVARIWLDTNLEAHSFVDGAYWRKHFAEVKEMLAQAELYVCEEEKEICGFAGLEGDYIAGIFVSAGHRSRGIGKQLLDNIKVLHKSLSLHVYQRNTRAVSFYQREGFRIAREGTEESTGEKDYFMVWEES